MSSSSVTGPTSSAATPAPRRPSSPQLPRGLSFDPVSPPNPSNYNTIPLGTMPQSSFLDKILDCFAGIANCFRRRPSSDLVRTMSVAADQENGSPGAFSSRNVTDLSAVEDQNSPVMISDASLSKKGTRVRGQLVASSETDASPKPSLLKRIANAIARCFSGFGKGIQKDPINFAQPEEPAFVPSGLAELRQAQSAADAKKQKAAFEAQRENQPKRKEVNDYFHFQVENSCKKIAEAFNEFEELAPGVGSSDAFKKFLKLLKAEHKSLVKSLENAETVEEFCESVSKLEDALVRNVNSKGSTLSANARKAFRDYLGDAGYGKTVVDSLVSPSSTKKTGLETDKGMIAVHLLRHEFLKKEEVMDRNFPRLMQGSFASIIFSGEEISEKLNSLLALMRGLDVKLDPLLSNPNAPTLFMHMVSSKVGGFKAAVKELFLAYLKDYTEEVTDINGSIIYVLQKAEKLSLLEKSECTEFYTEIREDKEVQSAILRFFLEKDQAGKLTDLDTEMGKIEHMIKDQSAISTAVSAAREERAADQLQKAQAAAEKEKEIKALKQENFIKELKAKEGMILKGFEARLTEIRERAGQFEGKFGHPIPRLFEGMKDLSGRLIKAGTQSIQYDHINPETKQVVKRQGTIQEAHEHYNQIRLGLLGANGDELDQELLDLVTRCEGDFERAFSAKIALAKELAADLSKKAAEYAAMRKDALVYINQLRDDAVILYFDLTKAAEQNQVRLQSSVRAIDSFRRRLVMESVEDQTCGFNKAVAIAEDINLVQRGKSKMNEPDFLKIPDSDPVMVEMPVKRGRVRRGSTYEYKEPLVQSSDNGRTSPSITEEPADGRVPYLEQETEEDLPR